MIKINVDGSVVSVQETEALYSGSQNAHTCSFVFDTFWENFMKSAVFRVNGRAITAVIGKDNTCVLPWELLVRDNIGYGIEVGVYGVSADEEILTSVWDSIGTVREGSELGNDAREPSAGVYEQLAAGIKRVDNKVVSYSAEVQTLVQRAESAAAVSESGIKEATGSAAAATNAAAAAESALQGVRNALDSIPEGGTVVINDLTTGGTTAALSAEMGKVLARRPNPNLLLNGYFVNPINQRGQTEYAGAARYTIDRWKAANSRVTVTVGDGSVKVSRTNDTSTNVQMLGQKFDTSVAGKMVTASVLVTECSGTFLVYIGSVSQSNGRIYSQDISKPGLYTVTGVVTNETGTQEGFVFLKRSAGDVSFSVAAVKLELGDTQTLAHQDADGNWVLNEIPDYGEELRKCQRYFQAIDAIQSIRAVTRTDTLLEAFATGRTKATATLYLPVPMRTTPAVSWTGWEPSVPLYDLVNLENPDMIFVGDSGATVTSITARGGSGSQGRLNLDITTEELTVSGAPAGLVAGKRCEVAFEYGTTIATGKLYLDAEL